MHTEIEDRFYRVLTYQNVDRVPDIEFGYWPQTIRRWLGEGLPAEYASEKNQMFSSKLDSFFGFDELKQHNIPVRTYINPGFDEEIIERRGTSVVMRDKDGVIAVRYQNDVDESSIPHYLKFPVETPEDWYKLKERYSFDDPERMLRPDEVAAAQEVSDRGDTTVSIFFTGFYGQLRNWLGMENLSYAFYEEPEMVHDMADHWAELCVRQLQVLPANVRIDHVAWWEDMASNNGPLAGPVLFREFLQPAYHTVMTEARRRGCVISTVDCDGNPHDIVGNWMEEGVNIMFPLEVNAGVNPYEWRKEFGMDLRLRGGIGKVPIVHGGKAIDAELERIKPLLDQGGYIPHLDHLVPPDISFGNYCEYLEKKRKLIGK
ncbi:MAG: uroporphyrinogen decarboxylase family protein [bacterium]